MKIYTNLSWKMIEEIPDLMSISWPDKKKFHPSLEVTLQAT